MGVLTPAPSSHSQVAEWHPNPACPIPGGKLHSGTLVSETDIDWSLVYVPSRTESFSIDSNFKPHFPQIAKVMRSDCDTAAYLHEWASSFYRRVFDALTGSTMP